MSFCLNLFALSMLAWLLASDQPFSSWGLIVNISALVGLIGSCSYSALAV